MAIEVMSEIYLYNTLTRSKELFKPLSEGKVGMYHCGPTVYDYAHIGNFRSFLLGDLLRRSFEWNDYQVTQVMNITDVDDKTIRRSREEKTTLENLTRKYEDLFLNDLDDLNVLRPKTILRATENVPEMISLIERLIEKGMAYTSSDGVYFDIEKSKDYGALAELNLSSEVKERISNDEYDKESARDFALWKFYTDDDGEVSYNAPFGKGRPGWHIECSAMSMKVLGETFDIHTGGSDLIFPHHTNEIAQSEGATGKKFVNFWVHGAFITVDGKKMSKSLGNIITLETLRNKKIHPLAYRYLVLGAHYRSLLNFTEESLLGAENALISLYRNFASFENATKPNLPYIERFKTRINDDLDTPQALAILHELLHSNLADGEKKATLLEFDKVLGLNLDKESTKYGYLPEHEIPVAVKNLLAEREVARKHQKWDQADQLRGEIGNLGFIVEDKESGPKILRK